MSKPEEFWQSNIPFISDADGRRIDWTDAGLFSLATVATSFFESLAELIGTLISTTVIAPLDALRGYFVDLAETITTGVVSVVDFSAATSLATEAGFIGGLAIVVAGWLSVSLVIRVIRDG